VRSIEQRQDLWAEVAASKSLSSLLERRTESRKRFDDLLLGEPTAHKILCNAIFADFGEASCVRRAHLVGKTHNCSLRSPKKCGALLVDRHDRLHKPAKSLLKLLPDVLGARA
jgi:hypothetical protein